MNIRDLNESSLFYQKESPIYRLLTAISLTSRVLCAGSPGTGARAVVPTHV